MSPTPENTPQDATDVAALPVEEKIALTGGADAWHTHGAPSLGLDPIMVSDGPHGLRTQHGVGDNLGLNESVPATCFPPAVGLSATWSRSAAASVARAIGEEALAEGVSVVLGPGMNIKRSPLCGRNFEYFSEDPVLAGEIAVAYTDAIQELGVGVSVKHFALNNQETDRMRVDVTVDERTMHEIYLRAFRSVVTRAQPWTVMCSYNSVGGTLVSQNHRLLTEILRDRWGFDGLVVSDWGAVVDRPAAIGAGLDLQMPADPFAEADLRAAVEAGTVDPSALDRAARRNIELLRKGLAHRDPDASYDADAHHQVALEAARKALVLLQNDGVLPLAEDAGADIAVIGDFARTPRYQGAGSSHVNATRVDTALDAIRGIAGDVPFARGFVPGGSDGADGGEDEGRTLREEAVELARSAGTTLVFLGLGEDVESEGYDRTDMELPADQVELLRAIREVNENLVVVLSNGSAIRLPEEVRGASAVLEGWLLGQAGGQATADVLFGRVNPSGKLAESIPLQLADPPLLPALPGRPLAGHLRRGDLRRLPGAGRRRPRGRLLVRPRAQLHDLRVLRSRGERRDRGERGNRDRGRREHRGRSRRGRARRGGHRHQHRGHRRSRGGPGLRGRAGLQGRPPGPRTEGLRGGRARGRTVGTGAHRDPRDRAAVLQHRRRSCGKYGRCGHVGRLGGRARPVPRGGRGIEP